MEIGNYIQKVKTYNQHINSMNAGESYYMGGSGDATTNWSVKKSLPVYEHKTEIKQPASARESLSHSAQRGPETRSFVAPQTGAQSGISSPDEREVHIISREQVIEIPVYTERIVQDTNHLANLYGKVGLLVLENKRLRWKLENQPQSKQTEEIRSRTPSDFTGSPLENTHKVMSVSHSQKHHEKSFDEKEDISMTHSQQLPASHFKFLFEDLQVKFNALLSKYGEAREDIEKKAIELNRLNTVIKTQSIEIEHLASENQQASTSQFVEKADIYGKYKQLKESNHRLESTIFGLEAEAEGLKHVRVELTQLNSLYAEKCEAIEKLRAEVQVSVDDANVFKGLVAAREKEIDKLNQKIAELVKVAQEYTHIKQLLDIARRDVETYKEAYESREKLIIKLNAELGKIDSLGQALQAKASQEEFLEGEINHIKERLEDKEKELENARSKCIDQDLERFKNAELNRELNQTKAKVEYIEKKLNLKEEENEGLQRKLIEAAAKIEELKTFEIKLDQVSAEREELLNKIYQLKKDLVEANKMQKTIDDLKIVVDDKQNKLDDIQRKLEKAKAENRDIKARNDEMKTEILELDLKLKDADDVKQCLTETQSMLREANEENDKLEDTIRQLDIMNQEKLAEIAKVKNDLKEENEKNKTKMNMLMAENYAMCDKLKEKAEVEKQLERSILVNADLKNSHDNLVKKSMIRDQELGNLEVALEREKAANNQLQATVNELREVEVKNKELTKDVEDLAKKIEVVIHNNKELQQENQKTKEQVLQSQMEIEQLKDVVEEKEAEVRQVVEEIEVIKEQDTEALNRLEAENNQLASENKVFAQETEDWKKKYQELTGQFERYIMEYEKMSNKFDRMSAVNEDHVKDIENKAFTISQLHRRLLIQMIELHRIDSLRQGS